MTTSNSLARDQPRVHRSPEHVPDASLETEARALGRYVVGQPVGAEFIERYVGAHVHLEIAVRDAGEVAVLRFAVEHPALLPCLDAAAALFRPQSLLHRKALLMTAILEASPRHVEQFLPRTTSWPGLVGLLAWTSLTSALQVAVGLPLLLVVGRRA